MRASRVVLWLGLAAIAGILGWWVVRGQPGAALRLPPLDHSRPLPQGGFWVGATSEPDDLNPFTTADGVARVLVLRYTHDTLLERDPTSGELVPAAAESVELEPNGDALVVRLRPDLLFADGSPVTVDDLAFVFATAKAPGMQLGSLAETFDLLRGFERTGPRSFRLQLAMKHFKVRGMVGIGFPVLQARHWREAVAAVAARDGVGIPAEGTAAFAALVARVRLPGPGSGAYALARERDSGEVAWRRGVELTLVQNPASWRRAAQPRRWNLMGIRLRFLSDSATKLAELRAGRLDWYSDDDAEAVLATHADLRERVRLLEYRWPRLGHHMVVWNTRRRPYADVRVRQALSSLFDRRAIVDKLLRGHGQPAAAWFRPGDPEYPPDLEPVRFEPSQAREALEECGLVGGDTTATVSILVANELPLQRRILEEAEPAFRAAGLRLVPEQRAWADVVQRYESRDFDAVLMLWSHDPWIDPFANFHSSQADAPGLNYSGIEDAQLDELLTEARTDFDADSRAASYRQVAHRLRELEPVSLLVHPMGTLLIDRRFQGADPGALGVVADGMWVEPKAR